MLAHIMIARVRTLLIILLVGICCANLRAAGPNEFHYGYGGFSIEAGGDPSDQQRISESLDEYAVWGKMFIWVRGNYRLRISVCSAGKRSSIVANAEKAIFISKWKEAFIKEIGPKVTLEEKPYFFRDSIGIEIKTSAFMIARVFFVKELLFVVTFETQTADDLKTFKPILDTFRPLTKTERTLAMIDEFTPPPLPQGLPHGLLWSDATEIGLQGAVRQIRDTIQPDNFRETQVIQEQHFDVNGFLSIEIGFNSGLPDVITGWGWVNGKRVNIQSAVNYPPGEGPNGSRNIVISGYISSPSYIANANPLFPPYGNRFEINLDPSNRLFERRRYASNDSLVLVEHYSYSDNVREIRTTDASGGFMGSVRERLDAHKNVLETQVLSDNGSVVDSTQFEYQYDDKGNWIVKKAFRKASVGGRANKATGIVYRNILYYESVDKRQVG